MKIRCLLWTTAAVLLMMGSMACLAGQEKYPIEKRGITKEDSRTGLKRAVLPGIVLKAKETQRCDMAYSSIVEYSFIPARVAKALKAKEIGEIDFDQIKRARIKKNAPDLPFPIVLEPKDEGFVDNPEHIRVIYGMNKTNQRKFKVVRIEKVNLGAGPEFGPVEALVSKDENSDFGIIGRRWMLQAVDKKANKGFMYDSMDVLYYMSLPSTKRP